MTKRCVSAASAQFSSRGAAQKKVISTPVVLSCHLSENPPDNPLDHIYIWHNARRRLLITSSMLSTIMKRCVPFSSVIHTISVRVNCIEDPVTHLRCRVVYPVWPHRFICCCVPTCWKTIRLKAYFMTDSTTEFIHPPYNL